MKKNMMRRNLHRSIKKSIARYIAIVAIIALGAGIFVGLRTTKSDMIATGQRYMDQQNMFDLRLLSSYGWDKADVERIAALPGVEDAEGVISLDAIASYEGAETESVYKLYSIPNTVSKVYLHGGRMPERPDECLADGFHVSDDILGKQITVSQTNDTDTLDSLAVHTYTVVGYVSSPLYMDMSRGNTPLGNGTLSGFLYLPEDSFTVDYYAEIAITLPGEHTVYSDAYHDLVENEADRLKPLLQPMADSRYQTLLAEGEEAYADGMTEYEDGLSQYRQGKEETYAQLDEARQKLQDGEKELQENEKQLEDGLSQLQQGQKQIDEGRKTLTDSQITLAKAKAEAYSQLAQASAELIKNYKQVNEGIAQIDDGLAQLNSGISQLESGLTQLETMIGLTDNLLRVANTTLARAEEALGAVEETADPALLAQLQTAVDDAKAQIADYELQLADMKTQQQILNQQLAELQAQRAQLEESKKTLTAFKAQLDQALLELEASQTQAENEFAAAEAELEAGRLELESTQKELDKSRADLEDGQKQLEEGRIELEVGWKEYNEGFVQVSKELADAWVELEEGRQELRDARKTLDDMTAPDVFALGRTTNGGYLALDSNSDIVEGVSAVFPAFFLLIAALVCITTMTRMVDEERTQIGTLKALGYGSRSIIGKYLAYAGSAAIIGCGVGVVAGSVVFPLILWEAYQIIMFLGDYFLLRMNWGLCLAVVGVYTAVTLLVTWYCCRLSLREVPAELVRPKPPTTGKSILLEKLPFWNRISFLNKVMLRNIFRYRQRLFMMLVGIGGCTALLLTGFGLRDSIAELADYQFEEIILYDYEVRFSEALDETSQAAFIQAFNKDTDKILFYHQSSMELDHNDRVMDVNFIAAGEEIAEFIDFHAGKKSLSMPGDGEALISVGMAARMDISVGDTITLRDTDMRELSLRVSGIFDNNVYTYVVTTPRTVQQQWRAEPDVQMACVYASEGTDVHELGAEMSQQDGVMSVTVNADVQQSVGKMLEALDLVVITVVICAALLAVIVLYNLTNINITERLREIATIKVLGFHAGETAAYVFKENLLLSATGSLLGLVGGVFLLEFVISKVQVDIVWITARSMPMSYVWSVVITMLSACLVDFVLYFKLKKINMAEALKSVE